MNTIIYNTVTDIFLEWGRICLQKESFPDFLSHLEKNLPENRTALKKDLEKGIAELSEDLDSACELLMDTAIINAGQEDEIWYEAEVAFTTFDRAVWLMEAIEHIIRKDDRTVAEDLLSMLGAKLKQTSAFLYEPDFSSLRFCSFNGMRQGNIETCREDRSFLFPWHHLFSDADSDLLTILAEHWHEPENLPEVAKKNLPLWLSEIRRDPGLKAWIEKENAVCRALEKTLAEHWSFRFLQAAQMEGYSHILPESVEALGYENVTHAVLSQSSLTPGMRFLIAVAGACYAPGIEEERRLDLLLECETRLADISEEKDKTVSQCIRELKKLAAGTSGAKVPASAVCSFWMQQMESTGTYCEEQKSLDELILGMLREEEKESDISLVADAEKEEYILLVGLMAIRILLSRSRSMGKPGDRSSENIELPGASRIRGFRKDNVTVLLEDKEDNPEDLKKLFSLFVSNKPKRMYSKVLTKDCQSKWIVLEQKPSKVAADGCIILENTDHDCYIWILDISPKKLDKHAEIIKNRLNEPECQTGKIGAETIAVWVDVKEEEIK
ncbi:MAG: type III-E CRISPR-associated protein Csx30 [Desulfococcaceae bacterium]|nr:type III-E CRISPR-associated protein Csx30 [Desulfococcaceae bacterium]